MTIGERIRSIRLENGMTQKELGDKCGIADSGIRRYELGLLNPKIETLKKIASGLNVPVYELTGELYDKSEIKQRAFAEGYNKAIDDVIDIIMKLKQSS